ncbi:MAG: hypothetical protein J0H40_00125 [Rhizobiales bacterium]|nr:hypothetical protein [Hyphomicrobiales bacterium]
MSHIVKAVAATIVVALASLPQTASARGHRLFPLTRCGPGLQYLCALHGSFDSAPFHYDLAIHPRCIKTVATETPRGIVYRRAVVCGAPVRQMIWW